MDKIQSIQDNQKNKNEQYCAVRLFNFKVAETFRQFSVRDCRYFLSCVNFSFWSWFSYIFQRIALSMNETRSCAKLTAYSIAYNMFMDTCVTKHADLVLACTPILQAISVAYWLIKVHNAYHRFWKGCSNYKSLVYHHNKCLQDHVVICWQLSRSNVLL